MPPHRISTVVWCLFVSCVASKQAPTHREFAPVPVDAAAPVAPLAAQGPAAPVTSIAAHDSPSSSVVCPESHSISLLDPNAALMALATDPVAEPVAWSEGTCCAGDDSDVVRVGTLTFTQKGDDNTLIVTQDGKELWRSTFGMVAGGIVGIGVSPKGGLVQRGYSRGGVELFAAQSGRRLAHAGRAVQVAPDETFAIDPPDFEGSLVRFNRAEVTKHSFVPKLTHKTVARLPIPVRRELKDDSLSPSSFGVTICATSSLYAISFPTTELAVYRSADDAKLAAIANPGPGVPTFSKSGQLIVIGNGVDDKPRVFQLKP